MRKLSFFLSFALVFAFAYGAFAQTHLGVISIDGVSGMHPDQLTYPGALAANSGSSNATHAVSLRYNLSASSTAGLWIGSNAWEVYSPDGADWVDLSRADGPLVTALAPTVVKFRKFFTSTNDGVSYTQTGGVPGGSAAPGGRVGLVNRVAASFATVDASGLGGYTGGDNGIAQIITFSTLGADSTKTMCFDSLNGRGTVAWEWAAPVAGSDFPQWDNGLGVSGPRCFVLQYVYNQPPVFNAPNPGNVSFNHCGEGSFDLFATDPEPNLPITFSQATGPGTLVGNHWSWSGPTVPQQGADVATFLATDGVGGVSLVPLTLNITTTNIAPTIACGDNVTVSAGTCKPQTVVGADLDVCDVLTYTFTDPGVNGTISMVGNVITFCPTADDAGPVVIPVTVSDGTASVSCDTEWFVIVGSPYQVEIEKVEEQPQGNFADVYIKLYGYDPNQGLGGFDFLVAYDASALTFQLASEGDIYDACTWEYFTYRYGAQGNCNGACPSGLLRIIGLAETNNGTANTTCGDMFIGAVPITLAEMRFLVTNDRTLECQYVPIRFFWYNCGDNTLSNASGSELYLSTKVFEFTSLGNPFLGGEMSDTLAGFPTYQGAQHGCFFDENGKIAKQNIDFQNGGIDIVCADSIDAPGDVNLNGIAYEIADAVMFTNYFVSGLGAFLPHIDGSVAATDTNKDGISLSVADLVYLIRVIVGDALPYDKISPVAARVTVDKDGIFNSNQPLGAAYVVIAGDVNPILLASGMELKSAFDGQNTNVLVFSIDGNSCTGDFLQADGPVVSTEFAAFDGQPVVADVMPADFQLNQNYPNPFNPVTTIKVEIPSKGAEWKLNVYNVTGQLVQSFNGISSTGFETVTWDASGVSSGVYFYKLTSGEFSATKKAVLLK